MFFCAISNSPLITIADETYMNEIFEFCGLENIVNETYQRYPRYSIEEVVKQNPDYIFVVNMDTENRILRYWEKYKSINAVKRGDLYLLDPDKICRPSLNVYVKSLEMIDEIVRGKGD